MISSSFLLELVVESVLELNLPSRLFELALVNLMHQFDWKLPDEMNREDLEMGDSPGPPTRRRQSLQLVAKPFLA